MAHVNDIIRFLVKRSGLLFQKDKFTMAAAFVNERVRIALGAAREILPDYQIVSRIMALARENKK